MPISISEGKKIAELARLELTPAEEKRHAETISVVLEYMKILNEVDTSGVEPTYMVNPAKNIYREDVVVESKLASDLIKQMPEVEDNELVVPAVFGEAD